MLLWERLLCFLHIAFQFTMEPLQLLQLYLYVFTWGAHPLQTDTSLYFVFILLLFIVTLVSTSHFVRLLFLVFTIIA